MNEEEKKTIEKFIEKCNKSDESVEIKGVSVGEEYRILETVCKALNLVEKLQKENEELKNDIANMYDEEVVTVQKVKNKIEEEIKYHERNILDIENTTMLKGKTAKEEAEIEFNKYAIVVLKKMLQELLEGRK
jgi:hypothetical protein